MKINAKKVKEDLGVNIKKACVVVPVIGGDHTLWAVAQRGRQWLVGMVDIVDGKWCARGWNDAPDGLSAYVMMSDAAKPIRDSWCTRTKGIAADLGV